MLLCDRSDTLRIVLFIDSTVNTPQIIIMHYVLRFHTVCNVN
jgi:hypothetical protein